MGATWLREVLILPFGGREPDSERSRAPLASTPPSQPHPEWARLSDQRSDARPYASPRYGRTRPSYAPASDVADWLDVDAFGPAVDFRARRVGLSLSAADNQ
jgi:hypothetical protein